MHSCYTGQTVECLTDTLIQTVDRQHDIRSFAEVRVDSQEDYAQGSRKDDYDIRGSEGKTDMQTSTILDAENSKVSHLLFLCVSCASKERKRERDRIVMDIDLHSC